MSERERDLGQCLVVLRIGQVQGTRGCLQPSQHTVIGPRADISSRQTAVLGSARQPTVTFPIDDHINVLHDQKKTGPYKILKLLTCRCHHLIDMLVEFCKKKSRISNSLKWLNLPYPSILINFCLFRKNCEKFFRLLKSSKSPQLHCQQVLPANMAMSLLKGTCVR